MGEVWRALQLAEQRVVAIKILRARGGSQSRIPGTEERFRREIALAAQFDHPALTRILGSGSAGNGQPYVAMEWIDGQPLDTFLNENSLSLEQRVAMVAAIACGVQQLHERGCIHRDLKPDNILITPEALPKILDFGLARPLDSVEFGPTVSLDGDLIGTPHFMSPEQAAGESQRVGTRSDVWSLGLLLFFVISGKWPFPAELSCADVLQKILTTEPPGLRSFAPDTPKDLEAIVFRCLSRDPAKRYDGAGGVADDLKRWQRGEPVTARQATVRYLLANAVRRHRAITAAVGGVAISSMIAVFWHQHAQAEANRALQSALDDATSLRSYLLFDLRWNLDRSGREDILDTAARRAREFAHSPASSGALKGPKLDPRRFEALAANLEGQAMAFRGNFSGALDSCRKEHLLNLSLCENYPEDPQTVLNVVSSGIGLAGLLLNIEQPAQVRPVLEPLLQQSAHLANSPQLPPSTPLGDRLQILILLARADREIANAALPVNSRIKQDKASVGVAGDPQSARSPGGLSSLEEALSLLPAYESSLGASLLLIAAVLSEKAEWALTKQEGEKAQIILQDVRERLDKSLLATPDDVPLLAAAALCRRDLARACLLRRKLNEAWDHLVEAQGLLESMRKGGFFEPSMWRERAVARTAQDVAEAFLARHKDDMANLALHLSARMLEVNYHRPAAMQVPSADTARQNWLTARRRLAARDLPGAAISLRRAMDALEKCFASDSGNPVWLLDYAEAGIQLERMLIKAPRVDRSITAEEIRETIHQALAKGAGHPGLSEFLRQRLAKLSAPPNG